MDSHERCIRGVQEWASPLDSAVRGSFGLTLNRVPTAGVSRPARARVRDRMRARGGTLVRFLLQEITQVNIHDSVASQDGSLKVTLTAFDPDLIPSFRTPVSMIS